MPNRTSFSHTSFSQHLPCIQRITQRRATITCYIAIEWNIYIKWYALRDEAPKQQTEGNEVNECMQVGKVVAIVLRDCLKRFERRFAWRSPSSEIAAMSGRSASFAWCTEKKSLYMKPA
eukprot:1550160-Amphidinium_carterae.1